MEFITTKNFEMPKDKAEMEETEWFNMWKTKQFPYDRLQVGDILYFYETPTKKLVWKTKVVKIDCYPYSDKKKISDKFAHMHMYGEEYFNKKSDNGYYLGYKIEVIEKLELKKSTTFIFPRLGWLEIDNGTIYAYFK